MFAIRATVLAVVALSAAATVGAQPVTPVDSIVATRHTLVLDGRPIHYTARAGLLPLYVNDTGELMARIFFISYTADPVPGEPRRPLTFLWNGGPGSSSSQVHLVGFGPRRVRTANTYPEWAKGGQTALGDNQESWLGVSDLVFVDPIGTGYSRATRTEFRDILYTDRGDTEAVAEFIRVYRTRFDAFDAPLFLAGESYGTTRAMGVAEALEKRRAGLAGVVLISGFYDAGQRVPQPLNTALQLPQFTVAAHFHRKLPADLQTLSRDDAARRATEWARTVYAPALARRDSLAPDERSAVVAGLARFTGLPASEVNARTLSISKPDFSDKLLRDRNLELGRYDSRMTATRRGEKLWMPMLDPSLLAMIDLMQGSSPVLIRYIRDTLNYRSDLLYRGPFGEAFHPQPLTLNPAGIGSDWMAMMWNRGGLMSGTEGGGGRAAGGAAANAPQSAQPATPPPPPPLQRAMEINTRLRVLNMKGMFDGSCAALDEAVARTDETLRARVTNRCYAGGHMMYSDLEVRRQMQRDFADFVRSTTARQ
jgi:carboxypeptidase C (cathepsin A)